MSALLLLCAAQVALAAEVVWWVDDPKEAAAVQQALDEVWPAHAERVELAIEAGPHRIRVDARDGVLVLQVPGHPERRAAAADPWSQAALLRSWVAEGLPEPVRVAAPADSFDSDPLPDLPPALPPPSWDASAERRGPLRVEAALGWSFDGWREPHTATSIAGGAVFENSVATFVFADIDAGGSTPGDRYDARSLGRRAIVAEARYLPVVKEAWAIGPTVFAGVEQVRWLSYSAVVNEDTARGPRLGAGVVVHRWGNRAVAPLLRADWIWGRAATMDGSTVPGAGHLRVQAGVVFGPSERT